MLSWEVAIAKMTGLPAARLNIQDRGLLRRGAAADLVVFDPERVVDRATLAQGKCLPEGFEWVLVNGQVVVGEGAYRGGGFGKALRPLYH